MKVRTAHVSMEVFDNNEQQAEDVSKVLERAVNRRYAWLKGTEAGDAGNVGRALMRQAPQAGYKPWVPAQQVEKGEASNTDCWILVREDLVNGNWKPEYTPVIPGAGALYREAGHDNWKNLRPRWAPKGLVTVAFDCDKLGGRINLGVTHHLTKGRTDNKESVIHGVDHFEWNQKLDRVVSQWGRRVAQGRDLAFFSTDRNLSDRRAPVDEIEGFTSLADELRDWQPTGHGDIDWMLSFNRDGRVSALDFTVLDDREFRLHTDHFFCEGTYNVEVPRR